MNVNTKRFCKAFATLVTFSVSFDGPCSEIKLFQMLTFFLALFVISQDFNKEKSVSKNPSMMNKERYNPIQKFFINEVFRKRTHYFPM